MGRTLPTPRRLLDELEFAWRDFRRTLPEHEQARWDALWQMARAHASSIGNQAPLDPMQAVFLSILLEQQRALDDLRRALGR